MNRFKSNSNLLCLSLIVVVFAFAKANSQQSSIKGGPSNYMIDRNFDRTQLFETLKKLKTNHGIEIRIVSYSHNQGLLKKLGIALKPVGSDWIQLESDNSAGIDAVCVEIDDSQLVHLQLCNQTLASIDEVKTVSPKIANGTRSAKPHNSVRADSLKTVALYNRLQRQNEVLQERADQNREVNEKRAAINSALIADADSLKQERSNRKRELQELQIEVNENQRKRTTLNYNNKREEAKRDSLKSQQLRLESKLEEQQKQLAEAKAEQVANEQLIAQQRQVIEEQGLQSETANSLKAYRTALLGETNGEPIKSQGYLIFAFEQCTYKVYEGYTIVYGTLGKFLFTINKELAEKPMSGSLKIQGKDLDYTYSGNILYIKNDEGQLVNENGDALATVNRN